MADETLIDKEIRDFGEKLLEPFETESVKGASYDIRVGARVRRVLLEPGRAARFEWIALDMPGQDPVSIPPGSTCIIQSLEKVHMPRNMKGRLALRAFHARKLLFFAGGVIDPGFDDYLKLPMANIGDVPVEINYGESIVSAEFVKLNKEAIPYERSPDIPEGEPTVFDREKLSREIKQQGESIEEILRRLESNGTLIHASQRILDMVVLAAVAAGVITAGVILLPKLGFPWNVVAVGLGAAFGAGLVSMVLSRFRAQKK
jgi:deoxycytidine triphosphate deaminase